MSFLHVGGVWQAPMGFAFRKTGSRELTLVYATDMEDVLEAIERLKKAAKKAGIRIIIRGSEP